MIENKTDLLAKGMSHIKGYAIFLLSPEGAVLTWNQGAEELKGYQAEEVIGKSFSVFCDKKSIEAGHPLVVLKLAKEQGYYSGESWCVRKDGSRFWSKVDVTAIYENEKLVAFTIITCDITNTQRYLQFEGIIANLKLAMSSTQLGLWSWDVITGKVDIDSNTARLLNINFDTFNQTFDEAFAHIQPNDQERIKQALKKSLNSSELNNEVFGVERPDGSIGLIAVRAQAQRSMGDTVTQVVGVFWEIADKKELIQVQGNSEKAENPRKQNEELADTICHEMRNPLQGIVASIEIQNESLSEIERHLSQETGLNRVFLAKIQEQLAILRQANIAIDDSCQHQCKIIDNLLKISKLNAGKVTANIQPFLLNKILKIVIEQYQLEMQDKKITFNFALPQKEYVVLSDELQFKQILLDIFSNVVKDTFLGGYIMLSLDVKVQANEQAEVLINIKNSGAGFNDEEKEQLFNRFSQISRSRHIPNHSSEFGLALCKKLCALLEGEISLESEKMQGSRFYLKFRWPLGNSLVLQVKMTEPVYSSKESILEDEGEIRILIVEDNPTNQTLMKRLLEKGGYNCDVANDGRDAICKFHKFHPHIIFMDIEMPELNGFDATAKIRNIEKNFSLLPVAIYAWTAYSRSEYQEEAKKVGFSGFITKPTKKNEIYALIDKERNEKRKTNPGYFFQEQRRPTASSKSSTCNI